MNKQDKPLKVAIKSFGWPMEPAPRIRNAFACFDLWIYRNQLALAHA